MIENGLQSSNIQNADDVANLSREGVSKLYENDGIGDSDGDGFYDSEEKLTGHDPNDPDDRPTQEEVDRASFGIEE